MWRKYKNTKRATPVRLVQHPKLKVVLLLGTIAAYSAGSLDNKVRRPLRRRRRGREEYYVRSPASVSGVRG